MILASSCFRSVYCICFCLFAVVSELLAVLHIKILFQPGRKVTTVGAALPPPRVKMGLAENVSALLETYDNCVSLLKAFKKQKKQDPCHRPSKADEKQALLRRSLRADRKKVDRAYASRVNEAGSLFEKGDSKRPLLHCLLLRLSFIMNVNQ